MSVHNHPGRHARGMALISSLLLLLVVTILALSMFRSFGIQEKIAGNVKEKQRALHAAESAQQYAEWWLSNNPTVAPTVCASLLNANINQGQICSNRLKEDVGLSVAAVPWQSGGADIGVTYNPGMNVTTTAGLDTFYAVPRFYIADLGLSADGSGEVYRVDAAGYGGNADTVAVVESTMAVKSSVTNRGGP
jgi:type IV pilus assembly protein PilX